MYGCIFCAHQGCTLEESDATVFFTTKALLSHIARHPRPLPDITGLAIIDGPDVPTELANDFDLHFLAPPATNPCTDNALYISQQPTATAREQARRLYGQRLLHDRSAALELAQGARITGLEWPEQYHGDWCYGWHDGVHATVPTDIIRIDPPPMGQIKMSGTSLIRAKARWKFSPKDKDKGDWLKFDKGDVITNINCMFPTNWCAVGSQKLTMYRAISGALVLVGDERQGQMGHLPAGVYGAEHGTGAERERVGPGEHPQQREEQVAGDPVAVRVAQDDGAAAQHRRVVQQPRDVVAVPVQTQGVNNGGVAGRA